jgi:hypothetical protein
MYNIKSLIINANIFLGRASCSIYLGVVGNYKRAIYNTPVTIYVEKCKTKLG